MEERIKEVLASFNVIDVRPFNKGWSDDDKYIVITESGKKHLLRLSEASNAERCKRQVHIIEQAMKHNIPTQAIVSHGYCLDETKYFILLEWIEAGDAEEELLKYNEGEQYALGLTAGQYLKQIQKFPSAVKPRDDWDVLFNRKIDKKLEMYRVCELKYENDELMLDRIDELRKKLSNVRQVVHHGDYHLGNMLIDDNHELYIIDFDRHDIGDPWEEFNRLPFSYDVSPKFASGLVDGYFDGEVPENFWEMLCLYISVNALSALPWAMMYGDAEITTMKRQTESIFSQYENFSRNIPIWYAGHY